MVGMLFTGAIAFSLVMASAAQADFLPTNNLHLQKNKRGKAQVTEEQFNATIDRASALYGDIVTAHGARLRFDGDWENDQVNARASQFFGSWTVEIWGGLARRPEITPDGLTLVICHELGHHLAGYPFVSSWGADEGQADYFATQECGRRFWQDERTINATFRDLIPDAPKAKCDAVWTDTAAQDLCYRVMMAAKSNGDLLGALDETTPAFDTPDTSAVDETDHRHPAAQCRLDTYMAGAICAAEFADDVIPGKIDGSGDNNIEAEKESARHTCMQVSQFSQGLRPGCWFKSLQ